MADLTPAQGTALATIAAALVTIVVAAINKYKPKEKIDRTELLFKRYDLDRKNDRADLEQMRKELNSVKQRLDVVQEENRILREENQELREEIDDLRQDAIRVAGQKIMEEKK